MTEAAIATIGHNSASVFEMLDEQPELVYQDKDIVEQLYAALEAEIKAHPVDLTTAKGRAAITTLSGSISTRRAMTEKAGLALTEFHRKETKKVNEVKTAVLAKLAEYRDLARKPLTDWEKIEDARKGAITDARVLFSDATNMRGDMADALGYLERVKAIEIKADVFLDMEDTARTEQAAAITALEATIARLKQEAADREELDRLRAEKLESERAAAEAETKRQAEAEAQKRIDDAAKAAAERAAEDERRTAQAAIDAANKAAAEAQAELDRQAAEKAEAERQEALREADIKHRGKIMGETKRALMKHGGIEEEAAKTIVLAIIAGSVPNVTLRF